MIRHYIGLAILFSLSCRDNKNVTVTDNVWIKGIVENQDSFQEITLLNGYDQTEHTQRLRGDYFHFGLNISEGTYFHLRIGKSTLAIYLSPGYNVEVEYDALKPDETIFRGRGCESNNYLRAFETYGRENRPAYNQWFSKSENEFLEEARRFRAKCDGFLQKYIKEHVNLDPTFFSKERARILYTWANLLIQYRDAKLLFTGDEEYLVSNNFHDYKKTVNLGAIDLLSLTEYQNFLKAYVESEASYLKNMGDKREMEEIRFDIALHHVEEQDVLDFVLFSLMKQSMQHGLNLTTEKLYSVFRKKCQNMNLRSEIANIYESWKALKPGTKAPEISGINEQGTKESIDELKGKYIYLIFWASWCQPCTTELGKLTSLPEHLVTISVSLDERIDQWNKTLKQNPAGANRNWWFDPRDTDIYDKLMIKGLPRYLLIDPEGKIVDVNAPGPDNPELLKLLEESSIAFQKI